MNDKVAVSIFLLVLAVFLKSQMVLVQSTPVSEMVDSSVPSHHVDDLEGL